MLDDPAIPSASPPVPDAGGVDLSRKFVRVLRTSAEGMVAFEFAIGWPDLAVELAMPRDLFEQFCHKHQVVRLHDEDASPRLGDGGRDDPGEHA